MKLAFSALIKMLCGILLAGLLVFLPAGTLHYPNGWLLIGVLFIPMLLLGVLLFVKAPALLRKRLDTKEKEKTQKAVILLSALGFIGGFAVAGLDFRYGWSHVPMLAVIAAAALFLAGYAMYAEVCRENAYLSRTVKVTAEQKVIATGLYGIVRHPMYGATVLMFLAMPVVLGSWYALLVFLHYPVLITVRIRNEEKVLTEGLQGYEAYKQKVKYRLIPFVW